jgi:hypothetical protein
MAATEEIQVCKYNTCNLQEDPCLSCLIDYIKEAIHERVNEHEGEMTMEEFKDIVCDVVCDELRMLSDVPLTDS